MVMINKYLNEHPSGGVTKPITPENGELLTIRESDYMPSLPVHIREIVNDVGYIARYYIHDPLFMSYVLEACLQNNRENGSIELYNSSTLKKEKLYGNLVYYAVVQINFKTAGLFNEKEENESETAIMAVYKYIHDPSKTVIVIASPEVVRYDSWMDQIHVMIEHYLVAKRSSGGNMTGGKKSN
jgi:hypothetical protein